VQSRVNSVASRAYSSIAVAIVLSVIPKVDAAVGIGSGGYQGYGAVSIGHTVRIDDGMKAHGGGSTSSARAFNGGNYPSMVAGVRG
jgi:hypothetical protein